MEETDDAKTNGVFTASTQEEHSMCGVLRRLLTEIVYPDPNGKYGSAPVVNRVKGSLSEHVPLLREASTNTGRHVISWARRGTPLRALLVISVGTIAFLTLSGLAVFMLFFLAATVNAIVISLLVSLAAAGGFLALFFACVVAIYIVALSIAAFVISAITISAVVAAIIAAGWIGFFCIVWLATKKSVGLAKHSVTVTGSALSAYSSARRARRHPVSNILD